MKPILLGCSGPSLTEEERVFFAKAQPFGFILFARNCKTPDQLRFLTHDLRRAVKRPDAPIFIDQEGGRVSRLKPPHWPELPAAGVIGALYEKDSLKGCEAMQIHASITARFLRDVGIDGNCAPVLDLNVTGASSVMGDRTLSSRPDVVAELGRVAVQTYLGMGLFPVIKHLPGHGRVKTDPHEVLPFVDTPREILEAEDFAPFKTLAKEAPIAMNCHVVFRALDETQPVSLSRKVYDDIIRGFIGFEGLLFSDDLAMKALDLPLEELGIKALEAGADIVLYCPGVLEDSQKVCAGLPEVSEALMKKWDDVSLLRLKADIPDPRREERAMLDRLRRFLV